MRPRPVFYALVAASLLLAVAAGALRLKRFVDNDPRLCAQCHRASPEFSLWANGSHKSVACQRCHHSTPEQGLAMLRAFVSGRSPGSGANHAPVEIGACAQCHLSHDGNWPQVGASRGHRIHYQQQKIACVVCHAAGVHGFRPLTDACKQCHGAHTVFAQGMAKLHCFTCHDFLAKDPGLLPTRRDCLRCHQAAGVHPARFADDAPMRFDCGTCHKPHAATPVGALVACASCHAQLGSAGLHASAGHQRCGACHAAHLWRASSVDCLRCHARAGEHAEAKACASCHSFAVRAAKAVRSRK
ncbi:MAG TPA: hypothetical protein VMK42_07745 [Anaeromyxobacteraceae bacterium]|nr:hypothetical protein [Anaeromyxobacteraceae bacterium]